MHYGVVYYKKKSFLSKKKVFIEQQNFFNVVTYLSLFQVLFCNQTGNKNVIIRNLHIINFLFFDIWKIL